jgi:dTDP-4-dehydrorhamnose 3,5-epimerase
MSIGVSSLDLNGVKLIKTPRFADSRGFFSEVYNKRAFSAAGIDVTFVQDNHSLSVAKGTVRGLHFQIPPFAQAKLVRVIRGAIFDVAVDLRRGSPSYGRHISAVLSAKDSQLLFLPIGFAHGFCTLEPNTEVVYKVSDYYAPDHDRGMLWNDPDLAIDWPVGEDAAILSEKDRNLPRFKDLPEIFPYAPE